MTTLKEAFVGIEVAKLRNAVAIAEAGRNGEIRYMGEFDASPEGMTRLIKKLAAKHDKLHFCDEAGPTGYGLYRQIMALGHECIVVAPSLIPRRSGDRVKTNRRDAQSFARLLRAGELTAVWVPDETHEAVRDLVRTRGMAVEDCRRKRQHVTAFLLRHGRSYDGKTSWRGRHKRWLDGRKSIEIFNENAGHSRTLALFPEDRAIATASDTSVVQLRLSKMRLCRPRQWGACWLAGQLWSELQLDRFWADRLPTNRKGTRWDQVLHVFCGID